MSDVVSSQTGTLNYVRTDSITLPQSAAEARFAIRMSDWARLKRTVDRCDRGDGDSISGWYFCSFGITGSAGLSIIPLSLSTGVPSWAVPMYLSVAIFSLLLGLALVMVNHRLRSVKADHVVELKSDMTDIERGFDGSPPPPTAV